MGNSTSHRIFQNIDVVIQIFRMLDFEDQFNLSVINREYHDVILKNIPKHNVTMQTYLATYDDEDLRDYLKQWGHIFHRLRITGYGEHFSWKPMKILLNLTKISLTNISLFDHDIYWMAKELQNLQYLNFHCIKVISLHGDLAESDFQSKSIRKLKIPNDTILIKLINRCINLEELKVYNAEKNDFYSSLKLRFLSVQNVHSKIDDFQIANALPASRCRYNIVAKSDKRLEVNLGMMSIRDSENMEEFLNQKVLQLSYIKQIDLNCPSLKSLNILNKNCQQIQSLEMLRAPKEFDLSNLKTLKYLHITYSTISSDLMYSIINTLNLTRLDLENISYKKNSKNALQFSSNFKSSLKQFKFNSLSEVFKQFFENFPEIFKNLKQITFAYTKSSNSLIKYLISQSHWKLKRLILINCHMKFKREDLRNQMQLKSSIENVMMYSCVDVNGHFLQYLLAQNQLKYLNVFQTENEHIVKANKIVYPLDFAINRSCANTIRSITIDNIIFDTHEDFWYSYFEEVHASIQFTIHNACKSNLFKIFHNKLIRPKLKSIEFKNIEGKVDLDEDILNGLPLTITTLDFFDYCSVDFFATILWRLKSVLVIIF